MQFIRRISLGAMPIFFALAACSGGGGGGGGNGPMPVQTPTPTTQNQVTMALPTSVIGTTTAGALGAIGGYTQSVYSQTLGFVPGQQIMIKNGQSTTPHTLGDTGASGSFPAGQPATLTLAGTGSSTLSAGWQSGTINPTQSIGPITLSAGTYLIGCAYHYASNGMRDVLVVAAGATPGPQASPPPGSTPPPGGGGGY